MKMIERMDAQQKSIGRRQAFPWHALVHDLTFDMIVRHSYLQPGTRKSGPYHAFYVFATKFMPVERHRYA